MHFKDQVVWITGASSGIGEALAYAFAREGATLLLSARRASELERVKGQCADPECVHIQTLDLAQLPDVNALVADWYQKLGRIDIVIHNGGISQRALAHEANMEVIRRVLEVNFFGAADLTRAILPYMQQQNRGHFVAISSLTGKFGFPLRAGYAASKHALHGYFESVYLENHAHNIAVTLVNPGRIRTQVSVNALQSDGSKSGVMDPGQAKGMSAEQCAAKIMGAVKSRRFEITIGAFPERLMVWLKRFIPSVFHMIAKRVSAR